jgi:hypothetical protein
VGLRAKAPVTSYSSFRLPRSSTECNQMPLRQQTITLCRGKAIGQTLSLFSFPTAAWICHTGSIRT